MIVMEAIEVIILVGIAYLLLQTSHMSKAYATARPPKAAPLPRTNLASGCDGSLEKFIGHPEGRFKILKECVTVTGTVVGSPGPHFAPDGDLVFALKLDPPYASLVPAGSNKDAKMAGGIWCEEVCQGPNKATEPKHKGDCQTKAPPLLKPKLGQKLKVMGRYLQDIGEADKHYEIHPVYSVTAL
jgi:hypothetical protein